MFFVHLICPCAFKRTVVVYWIRATVTRKVATKEHKRHVKGLIERLESRVHSGPRIEHNELLSVRDFLHQNDFSPASEYFRRLGEIQERLVGRANGHSVPQGKRNYGGQA